MDFLVGIYDKLINVIIDNADLNEDTSNPNEIVIKCETCNNKCKTGCECRCHFRSCGKCDNLNCEIKSCTCDCHQLSKDNLKYDDKEYKLVEKNNDENDNKSDNSEDLTDRRKLQPKRKTSKVLKTTISKAGNTLKRAKPNENKLNDSCFNFDSNVDDHFITDEAVRELAYKHHNKEKILKGFVAKFIPQLNKPDDELNLEVDFQGLVNEKKLNQKYEDNPELKKEEEAKKKQLEEEKKEKEKEKAKEQKKRMQSKFGNFILGIAGIDKEKLEREKELNKPERKHSANSVINLKRIDGSLNQSLNSKYNPDITRQIIKFKPKKDIEKKKSKLIAPISKKEQATKELSLSPFRSKDKKEVAKHLNSSMRGGGTNDSFVMRPKSVNFTMNNNDNSNGDISILGARIKKSFKVNRIFDLKTPEMLEDLTDEKFVRDKGKITNQVKQLNLTLNQENYRDEKTLSENILSDFIQQPSWQGYSTMMFADIKIKTPDLKTPSGVKKRPKFFNK